MKPPVPVFAVRVPSLLLSLVIAAAGAACRDAAAPPANAARPSASTPAPAGPSADATVPAPARPRVVVLGDSLSAGYGLPSKDDSFPALMQKKADAAGLDVEIVNMGVSGDTTAGGLSRLDWALDGDVRVLVVALGGNDGLRGLGPEQLRANLAAIIERAQLRNIAVLLCGMEAPPNLGERYASEFRAVYRDLAKQRNVQFLPFLLDGVAGVESLNQPDGIHPNHAGTARVADLVWTKLRPMIDATKAPTS